MKIALLSLLAFTAVPLFAREEMLRDSTSPDKHYSVVVAEAVDLNMPLPTDFRHRVTLHETQWAQLDADRAERAKILEPLSPAQRVRLEEITLQWEGALCAFIRPTIAAKLKLSPGQNRRIETVFTLYRDGLPNAGLYAERLGSTDGGHQLLFNKAADRLAESILTVEQRLRWNEMQGRRLEPEPTHWRSALLP